MDSGLPVLFFSLVVVFAINYGCETIRNVGPSCLEVPPLVNIAATMPTHAGKCLKSDRKNDDRLKPLFIAHVNISKR